MTNLKYKLDGDRKVSIEYDGKEMFREIKEDENGKYFNPPNFLNKRGATRFLFRHRVYDAYQSIMNGDADVIYMSDVDILTCRFYLDRDIGDKIRNDFINTISDLTPDRFFYYIMYPGSFGGLYVADDLTIGSGLLRDKPVKKFRSDQEAIDVINKICNAGVKLGSMSDEEFSSKEKELCKDPIYSTAIMLLDFSGESPNINENHLKIYQSIIYKEER